MGVSTTMEVSLRLRCTIFCLILFDGKVADSVIRQFGDSHSA